MKKILSVLAGFMLLVTISCRGGDDEVVNPIAGKWAMQKFTYSYVQNGQTVTEEEIAGACERKSTIEFRANNKGTDISYYDDSGTCVLESQNEFSYSYDQSKGMLSISSPDGTQSVKVESLTNSEMVLSYETREAGFPMTIKITVKKV